MADAGSVVGMTAAVGAADADGAALVVSTGGAGGSAADALALAVSAAGAGALVVAVAVAVGVVVAAAAVEVVVVVGGVSAVGGVPFTRDAMTHPVPRARTKHAAAAPYTKRRGAMGSASASGGMLGASSAVEAVGMDGGGKLGASAPTVKPSDVTDPFATAGGASFAATFSASTGEGSFVGTFGRATGEGRSLFASFASAAGLASTPPGPPSGIDFGAPSLARGAKPITVATPEITALGFSAARSSGLGGFGTVGASSGKGGRDRVLGEPGAGPGGFACFSGVGASAPPGLAAAPGRGGTAGRLTIGGG